MPGWTEENFGNDGARQFLEMQAARLVTTIHDIIGSKDRIAPDDDGESMLMPCVEVLALLCEQKAHGWPLVRTLSPDGEIGRIWTVRRTWAETS